MIKYFSWILNNMTVNQDMNDYEFMVVEACLRRHPDADKKIGAGVKTFQIRNHPEHDTRCYMVAPYRRVVRRLLVQEVRGGALPGFTPRSSPVPEAEAAGAEAEAGARRAGRGGGRGRGGRGRGRGRR